MSDAPKQSDLEWVETDALVNELANRSNGVVVAFQLKSSEQQINIIHNGNIFFCLGLARALFKDLDNATSDPSFECEEGEESGV